MKLEDVTVALRPREPWEAVDLGCSMVRRDFGQLMALWAATVLPVWCVIIVLMHDIPVLFSLVIWWLKPLYDRVPLFFISKAAFGVRPGFRETWKAWPRLWSKDLFPALILRRLSFIRSFALPVIMLEGQKGKAMRARISALATDGGGSGASVSWVFVKLEIAVLLGLIAFTSEFVPSSVSPDWADLITFQDASDFTIQPAYYWWFNICYLFAVTLVEPFYVGAGFGLYLNCRTRLEGWDVELAFRRLASRLRGLAVVAATVVFTLMPLNNLFPAESASERITSPSPQPSPKGRGRQERSAPMRRDDLPSSDGAQPQLPLPEGEGWGEGDDFRWRQDTCFIPSLMDHFALVGMATVSSASRSSEKTAKPTVFDKLASDAKKSKPARAAAPETQAANKAADEILKRPEFKVHTRKTKEWVSDPSEVNLDFNLLKVLAYIAFWLVLAAVIAGLVIFLMRNRHLLGLPQLMPQKTREHKGPRVVMGMDIGRDSLPDDIVAAARELWKTKGSREALSLLYRGALSQLVERHRLPIRDSDTEDDCLDHVRRVGDRRTTGYFSQLTNAWISDAYAGITSAESEFDRLCGEWPFQSARSPQKSFAAAPAVVLLLIMPFIASCDGHWEDVEKTLGYKGKARTDPFLAAEMLLRENGHKAERTPTLGKLPEAEDGIVFTSSEAGVPEGRAKQLLSWVAKGGHLVYSVAGSMPYNDWSGGSDFFINFGTDERPDPVLTKLGVKLTDHRPKIDLKGKKKRPVAKPKAKSDAKDKDTDKTKKEKKAARIGDTVETTILKWDGKEYALELSDKITFKPARDLRREEWSTAGDKEPAIVSLQFGAGRITLLNHARPLRNKHIGDNDHAAWLVALAGENHQAIKDVRFVVGMTAGFWTLLWQRAWMPLVALAFMIAVWLWKNGRRFGPIMPMELSETKHFTDHVSALGQFFFRLRRGDVLLTSAADAVRARFRQRFPQIAEVTGAFSPVAPDSGQNAPITPESANAMIELLAKQSGLSKERVQAALAAHPPGQNHQLVRLLHDLQLLRQSL